MGLAPDDDPDWNSPDPLAAGPAALLDGIGAPVALKLQIAGRGDKAYFQELIELRNALAHGNSDQLDRLRSRGVADTITWARSRLPGLTRTAKALDRLVWNHLNVRFGVEPW